MYVEYGLVYCMSIYLDVISSQSLHWDDLYANESLCISKYITINILYVNATGYESILHRYQFTQKDVCMYIVYCMCLWILHILRMCILFVATNR